MPPTNVVVAGSPSDSDEKDRDGDENDEENDNENDNDDDDDDDGEEEEELLDFTQTDYAAQMSQADLEAEDDDDDGGGKKSDGKPTKPKALHRLSEKVGALAEVTAVVFTWRVKGCLISVYVSAGAGRADGEASALYVVQRRVEAADQVC